MPSFKHRHAFMFLEPNPFRYLITPFETLSFKLLIVFCSKYTPTLKISENKSKHISHVGIFNNKKRYFIFDNFIHVYIMNWDNFLFAWFLFIVLLVLTSQSKFPLSPFPRHPPHPIYSSSAVSLQKQMNWGNFYPHFLYLSTIHLRQKDEPLPLPLESPPYIVSFVFLLHLI